MEDVNIKQYRTFIEYRGGPEICVTKQLGPGHEVNIADFVVDFIASEVHISRQGEKEFLQLNLISMEGGVPYRIEKKELLFLQKKLSVDHPEFYATRGFRQYLSNKYGKIKKDIPEKIIYDQSGWFETQHGFRYVTGQDSDCVAAMKLVDIEGIEPAEICKQGLGILDVGDMDVMLPLFLQMHFGYMAKLFVDAGCPIQHVFGIGGSSGSRKTSIAKTLYTLFGTKPLNFQATPTAIEKHMAEACWDGNALIDNVYDDDDQNIKDKLSTIIWSMGDSIGRSRTRGAGTKLEQFVYRDSCIITSESLLERLQLSERLRCVFVQFTDDTINNEKFQPFRDDPHIMEQYMTAFIHYVEKHYQKIVRFIQGYRPPVIELIHDRLKETFRNFVVMANIVDHFVCDSLQLPSSERARNARMNQWVPILQKWMQWYECYISTADPYYLFLETVYKGVTTDIYAVAENKEKYVKNMTDYQGFWDHADAGEKTLRVEPDTIFTASVKSIRRLGYHFTCNRNDLFRSLHDHDFIEVYKQKNHPDKLLLSTQLNGHAHKFLTLKWAMIEDLFGEKDMPNHVE